MLNNFLLLTIYLILGLDPWVQTSTLYKPIESKFSDIILE